MRIIGVAAAVIAVMTLAASPAEARRNYDRHRGNNNSGAVVVAGIAGIAIGALAGSRSRYGGGYYGQPQNYYGPQGYYGQQSYYGGQGYYGQQGYYNPQPRFGYPTSNYGNVRYGYGYENNRHAYHSARKERKHQRRYNRDNRRYHGGYGY